jgi:peptidyl-prolyl cis-trans isomerase SurA
MTMTLFRAPQGAGLRMRMVVLAAALVFGAPIGAALAPAAAQNVLALVNNRAITNFDVQQRVRIAGLIERRRISPKAALQELIDDQVKLIEAGRVGYRITTEGVDAEFTRIAKGSRQTVEQFNEALRRSGIQPEALRESMRAGLAWEALLRDRTRRGSEISNSELDSAVEEERRKAGTITEFELVQVLFIVPQGVSPAARMQAANAARSRFTSCETGFDELRTMQDVAVRDRTVRTSADMPKPALEQLNKTPVGRMLAPSVSAQGIELVAVCGKNERNNPAAQRSTVAQALAQKKIGESSKTYIEALRKKVDIRYR